MFKSISELMPVSDLFTDAKYDAWRLNKPFVEIIAKIILNHNLKITYEMPANLGTNGLSLFINVICWREENPDDWTRFPINITDYKSLKIHFRKIKIDELSNG